MIRMAVSAVLAAGATLLMALPPARAASNRISAETAARQRRVVRFDTDDDVSPSGGFHTRQSVWSAVTATRWPLRMWRELRLALRPQVWSVPSRYALAAARTG